MNFFLYFTFLKQEKEEHERMKSPPQFIYLDMFHFDSLQLGHLRAQFKLCLQTRTQKRR